MLIAGLRGIRQSEVDVKAQPFRPSDYVGKRYVLEIQHDESDRTGTPYAKITAIRPLENDGNDVVSQPPTESANNPSGEEQVEVPF